MNEISETTQTLRPFLLAALLVLAVVDCDGGCSCGASGGSQVPSTAHGRVQALAEHLPADVDMALFFPDLPGVRSSLAMLAGRFSGSLPVDAYTREITEVLGVDLLDEASYSAAGIAPNGGFAFATVKGAPLLLIYLTDPVRFETQVIGALRKHYRVAETPKVDPATGTVTLVGSGVEFSYKILPGGLAVLVGRPPVGKRGSAELLAEIVNPQETLADLGSFENFAARVADAWPASVYLSTRKVVELYKGVDPSLKKYQWEVIDAFADNIEWVGAGWSADPKAAHGRAFFGIKPETLKSIAGLDRPPKAAPDFKRIVPDKAYLFVRTSINAKVFWREYQKLMPKKQLRFLKHLFKNVKASTSIDLEADLVNNMTGNVGLVVTDIDLSKLDRRRASERMKVASFLAYVQLIKPQHFLAMADRLVGEFHGAIRRRDLPGGLIRYGFSDHSTTAPPFALYVVDDLVTVASTTVPEEQIIAALVGGAPPLHRHASTADAKKLLTEPRATGFTLNLARLRQRMSSIGGALVNDLLGPTSAAVVRLELEPDGIAATGELAFVPSEAKPKRHPEGGPQ